MLHNNALGEYGPVVEGMENLLSFRFSKLCPQSDTPDSTSIHSACILYVDIYARKYSEKRGGIAVSHWSPKNLTARHGMFWLVMHRNTE